jgi:acetyl esterase/lipase
MLRSPIIAVCVVAALGGASALVWTLRSSSNAAPTPAFAAPPPARAASTEIKLWPGTPPDTTALATAAVETTVSEMVSNVSRPTMIVYPPRGKNTGVAVLVFPGGGYRKLAIELEGTEMCDWLVVKGITCVLLKYRVPASGPYWDPQCKCHVTPPAPLALEDAQRALGLVRARAAEWHIDPHKIGVLGFSAGGHLAAAISTHLDRTYPAIDDADKQSSRPDFAVALYPGHLWVDEDKFELAPDIQVTKQTPPTFLVQAENDPVDDINHSLVYFIALKKAGVPVEMHLYAEGGHAFGLRPTPHPIGGWLQLFETWLKTIHMIDR